MKILSNNTYLLLIDEEAEVCRGQHRLLNNKVELIHEGHNYPYKGNKVIAYYPLTKEAKELDLPLLPSFEENIEILWSDFNKNHNRNCPLSKEQFVRVINYKVSQSKQFSLEDMEEAYYQGRNDSSDNEYNFDKFIKSLSTQQLPKEFKPIMVCGRCLKPDDNDEDCWSAKECSRNTDFPDTFKTITNSEGKEELIGIYKY